LLQPGGEPRGGAGRGRQADGQGPRARAGRRPRAGIHLRERPHGPGLPARRGPVVPRQGLRHLLPDRALDRDRSRSCRRTGDLLPRRRRDRPVRLHGRHGARRARADRRDLLRRDPPARRHRAHRHPRRRPHRRARRPDRRRDRGDRDPVQPPRAPLSPPPNLQGEPFVTTTPAAASTPDEVRVRFCPSPTGTPHVGMVRTALFNWAHARHHGGKLVFRIEDTDAARDSEESYHQLLDAMRWLGIDWDEGVEVGGPDGPYRQSQRGEIYQDVIARLKESGHIYESFSTAEEIAERHRAAGRDPQLGYDGHDRDLTEEQKAAFRAEGREPTWRLRMPQEDITFTDMVRGEITFKAGSTPDFVVVRANGQPLYTLVNPVDDALMRITHVLRGEDILSSTPRQIALYRALIEIGVAERVPEFGHLPYVMGEGNKKLSKRDPQADLFLYREQGFIP